MIKDKNRVVVAVVILKQHYVTLTKIHCFEKRNLMMHIHTSHKTTI